MRKKLWCTYVVCKQNLKCKESIIGKHHLIFIKLSHLFIYIALDAYTTYKIVHVIRVDFGFYAGHFRRFKSRIALHTPITNIFINDDDDAQIKIEFFIAGKRRSGVRTPGKCFSINFKMFINSEQKKKRNVCCIAFCF